MIIYNQKERKTPVKNLKTKFELTEKYRFELNDLISLIYVICAIGIITGHNMNYLFLTGCLISFCYSLKGNRINLICLNLAMVCLNLFYVLG